jgi:signal transduction histidine kinase
MPVVVENMRDYARLFPALAQRPAIGPRAEAFICVPLALETKTLGVLGLGYYKARSLGPQDKDLALALARQCAQALDRARLTAEAVELREQFLSIASHELNTPITALLLMVQTLKKHHQDPDRVLVNATRAEKQVQRLAKLVHQLLDVSRITGGRLNLEPEDFDLSELVREAVARASDEQGDACELRLDIAPSIRVRLDRVHVDQVVQNLISNAIKYGRKMPIDVSLSEEGGRARFTVKDQGLGIAPEHQLRIFQRFERAVSSRHYGGFGLGLWIVRQIVEACEGEILLDSAPDQGSTFTVNLPCVPRADLKPQI